VRLTQVRGHLRKSASTHESRGDGLRNSKISDKSRRSTGCSTLFTIVVVILDCRQKTYGRVAQIALLWHELIFVQSEQHRPQTILEERTRCGSAESGTHSYTLPISRQPSDCSRYQLAGIGRGLNHMHNLGVVHGNIRTVRSHFIPHAHVT